MKWWVIVIVVWVGVNLAYLAIALRLGRRREKLGLRRNPYTEEWEKVSDDHD